MAAEDRNPGRSTQSSGQSPRPGIGTDVAADTIARRAYELFEERGCEPGRDLDDWLRAERELTGQRRGGDER